MHDHALEPGLYIVATPIGHAKDITLHALEILQNADVLACEDTRKTRQLMTIHGIKREARSMLPYHDHNGDQMRPRLMRALEEGKSVAYVSDAGTPLIADPGYALLRDAIKIGAALHTAPGPSSVMAALCLAGLPTDRFYFAGFAPQKEKARTDFFQELADIKTTVIFFETAKRLHTSLTCLSHNLQQRRQIVLCREMTKKFQEVLRAELPLTRDFFENLTLRGEYVVLLGPAQRDQADQISIAAYLTQALQTMRVKDAAAAAAQHFGMMKKEMYHEALRLKDEAQITTDANSGSD